VGIGNEIWQMEGKKRACGWAMDNIKLDLHGIGKRILDLDQYRDR